MCKIKFIVKRNGNKVPFDKQKIINAISKAGNVRNSTKEKIANLIAETENETGTLSIEEVQDIIEIELMKTSNKEAAREYIRYRKHREVIRNSEAVNDSVLRLIDNKNEYLRDENSNKNASIASTQRDYMAGEVSKDISRRLLIPEEIMKAHDEGVIHIHK